MRRNRVWSKILTIIIRLPGILTISIHNSSRIKLILKSQWLLKNLKMMKNSRHRTMGWGWWQEVKACSERSRWQVHLEIRETYHLLLKTWYHSSEVWLNLTIRGIWLLTTLNSHCRPFRCSRITITISIIKPTQHQAIRVFLNATHSKTSLLRSYRTWSATMNSLTWSRCANVPWIIVRTKNGGTSRNFTKRGRCPLALTPRRRNS